MAAFLAFIVSIFTGWTLQEFCQGVLINFFSSLVQGGGDKLFSKLKANKGEEVQLGECLRKAISKNVKNSEIAEYISIHDNQKYLAALKAELLSQEHTFAEGSSDAKIVEDLQKELAKKPFFLIRLVKLYGQQLCANTQQTLDLMNEQIREIQKIKEQGERIMSAVQDITARTGYTLNITDSMTGDYDCPIPDKHFSRTKLVTGIKSKLLSQGAVYLYGGYKTGKTVLSCLVAREFQDYERVRIPVGYQNLLSIKDIVSRYDAAKKVLFVIDGLAYQDEVIIVDLCQYITRQNKSNWIFLLNGRQTFSQYVINQTGMEEVVVPSLDVSEVEELIPQPSKILTSTIVSLSGGNPMIALLMIKMLEQKGWPNDAEALFALFGFSPDSTLKDKFRSILKQIIPNRDAVKLLNRLLLIKAPFSRETSRQLSSIEPSIALPDSCFDDLKDIAIADAGKGEFVVTSSFSKTLTPDLLQQERNNCNIWLAEQIISRKELNELDVMRVLGFLLDGHEYDRAGFFYISCLTNLNSKASSFGLFAGIWIDLPLPDGMSNEIKILIRIQQIIFFCTPSESDKDYPVKDLENIIHENTIEPNLLCFSYQVLYYFYGAKGMVDRALHYLDAAKAIPSRPELSALTLDSLWMTLFKVTTTDELFAWIELYQKQGYPAYDFMEEMCNKAVSNIYTACANDDAEAALKSVIAKAEEDASHLWPFIVSAEANLIFCYGSKQLNKEAVQVYSQSHYLAEEYGKLMLNYAMGVFYYNNDDKDTAATYFKQVQEVSKIELSAINILYAYVYYAAIRSQKDTQESVAVLDKLVNHESFEKFYVESERAVLYGELAIAYWQNNEKEKSVAYIQKVYDYLWSCRDNIIDSDKVFWVKLSVMVTHYYGELNGLPKEGNFAVPVPAMFILLNDKLKDEYSDFRVLATTFYLYELQTACLWDKGYSLSLFDKCMNLFKDSVIKTQPQYSTLFLKCIPELLLNDRWDDVSYIITQSTKAVRGYKEVVIHPEGAIFTVSMLYMLLYRLDRKIQKMPFDESSLALIISDFISASPDDCLLATYLLDVIEGRKASDINFSSDPLHQTLLLLLNLHKEPSSRQWFSILPRTHVTLKKVNGSNACGKFLEIVTTDIFNYVVKNYPQDFYVDRSQKVLNGLQKYTLFDRSRAVISGFHYLMKNPPTLAKEVEELIEM